MSDDKALRIRVEGKLYSVDPGDISRGLALECMQDLGMSHEQICAGVFMAPGKLTLHAFMWLARRLAGEPRIRREGRKSTLLAAQIWEELVDIDDVDLLPVPEDDASPPV